MSYLSSATTRSQFENRLRLILLGEDWETQRLTWRRGNTLLLVNDTSLQLILHGTAVITLCNEEITGGYHTLIIDFNGYDTVTTRDRMNMPLRPLALYVSQEKGEQYLCRRGKGKVVRLHTHQPNEINIKELNYARDRPD